MCLNSLDVSASTIVAVDNFSSINLFRNVNMPLPPGDWKIEWENDFDFCNPENKTRCRADGRALILINKTQDESPFYALIVRHTKWPVRNWSAKHCYSRINNPYFDDHGTKENMLLNKCSRGWYRFGPMFQSSHWWWSRIKDGTDKIIHPTGNTIQFEILLQNSGSPRYQIDLLISEKFNDEIFSTSQLVEWKSRYVDLLSHRLFGKKLDIQHLGLKLSGQNIANIDVYQNKNILDNDHGPIEKVTNYESDFTNKTSKNDSDKDKNELIKKEKINLEYKRVKQNTFESEQSQRLTTEREKAQREVKERIQVQKRRNERETTQIEARERAQDQKLIAEKEKTQRQAIERAQAQRLIAEKEKAQREATERAKAQELIAEKEKTERDAIEREDAQKLLAEKNKAEKDANAKRLAAERAKITNKLDQLNSIFKPSTTSNNFSTFD